MARAVALALALALAAAPALAAFRRGSCATGRITPPAPKSRAQRYAAPRRPRSPARRLLPDPDEQDQEYDAEGAWVSVTDAYAAGDTRPLSIAVNTDLVTGGDAYRCDAEGQVVDPCAGRGEGSCAMACGAADVVTAAKAALAAEHAGWAAGFYRDALHIKPVLDALTVDAVGGAAYSDTDLVVLLTMRPHESGGVSGYAYCAQTDQHGRCTVGYFNWCPAVLDVSDADAPDSVAEYRHTATHEMNHLLGGIQTGAHFIDPATGAALPDEAVFADEEELDRTVRKIVTPTVLAVAREQFGCDELSGVPLEDLEAGVGAHWEARVLGAEFMSYGTHSGEEYVSDLTLAFLADTGQFVANYSVGGRLTQPSEDGAVELPVWETTAVDAPRTPGYLRWGRAQGCGFVTGSPTEEWSERYACAEHLQTGCTPDNRVSAVCALYEYGGDLPAEAQASCHPSAGCQSNDLWPFLPSISSWLGDSVTGGFSAAMDYAPVRVGFWNCQDEKPSSYNATSDESGATDMSALFATEDADAALFGGQTLCPECRCFESSLSEDVWTGAGTQYGLCYRANCYTASYLQFAIQTGAGETKWYRCPDEGGTIFIPGFAGSLVCPAAAEFCLQEEPSGVLYAESSLWLEWLIVLGTVGVPLAAALGCALLPRARARLVARLKARLGISSFREAFGMRINDLGETQADRGRHLLTAESAARGLGAVGACFLAGAVSIVLFSFVVYSEAPGAMPYLVLLAVVLGALAACALQNALGGGLVPSARLVAFYFGALLVGAAALLGAVAAGAFSAVIDDYLIVDVAGTASYAGYALLAALALLALAAAGLWLDCMLLGARVVAFSTVHLLGGAFLLLGAMVAYIAGSYAAGAGVSGLVVACSVLPGAMLAATSLAGVVGALRHSSAWLTFAMAANALNALLMLVAGAAMLAGAPATRDHIAALEGAEADELLASAMVSSAMSGMTLDKIAVLVADLMQLTGVLFLLLGALQVWHLACTYAVFKDKSGIVSRQQEVELMPSRWGSRRRQGYAGLTAPQSSEGLEDAPALRAVSDKSALAAFT